MAIINFAITVPDGSVARLRTALRAHYGQVTDAGTGLLRNRTNAELEEAVRQMVIHNLKSIIRSTEAAAAAKGCKRRRTGHDCHMIRFILAALIAIATVAPSWASHNPMRYYRASPAFPQPKNGVIYLDYMPGGVVGEHMRWAKVWLDSGYRIVIRDDQVSAAAMMVVTLKTHGARICAKTGADLYFHLLSDGSHPSKIIGHAKRIGPLTHRFKRIAPAKFGIPRCK